MVKPGRVMLDAFESVLHAATHSKRVRGAFDNLGLHFGDVNNRTNGIDVFDGKPDLPNGSPNPHRPDPNRKPPSMSDEEYSNLLESSVHNPDGLEAVLGKFRHEDTASYIDVAEGKHPPATYFSLGDEWGAIADTHNMDDKGMFDAFNVPFLERMMAEGKPISFSHNPLDFPDSALAAELDFLQRNGYVFDPNTMQAFLP